MFAQLKVVSATELSPRESCIPTIPNCYVRVVAGNYQRETAVRERNMEPSWNQDLDIPVTGNDTEFHIQLWHKSSVPLRSYKIGKTSTTWASLLQQQVVQKDKPLRLPLIAKKARPVVVGYVLVVVSQMDEVVAGQTAIKTAQNDVKAAKLGHGPDVPSDDALAMLQLVAGKLNDFLGILDSASQLHPIASVAWGIVSSVVKAINAQSAQDAQVLGLITTMDEANSFLGDFKTMRDLTPRLAEFVTATLKQTMECSSFIREFCRVGFMTRAAEKAFFSSAEGKIAGFKSAFEKLQKLRVEGATAQVALVSYRVLDVTQAIRRDQVLERLREIRLDTAGRPSCQPGTRDRILRELTTWIMTPPSDPDPKNIFWLRGMTGSGKSTVVTTIANYYRELRRLGAFLFFNSKTPGTSAPTDVIRTLAAQLGRFDSRIGNAIAEVIERNNGATEGPLSHQFSELLIRPLSVLDGDLTSASSTALSTEGPILVILDALDECGDQGTRRELLDVLAKQANQLPRWVRIVITSREDKDLVDALDSCSNIDKTVLNLSDPDNIADIGTYTNNAMFMIRTATKNKSLSLEVDWPGLDTTKELSRRAAGLFQWAATAHAFLDSHNPRARLKALLHGDPELKPERALDNLYYTTLESVGDWSDPTFVSDMTNVLGAIVVAHEPITVTIIDELFGMPKATPVIHTIESLRCVLTWDQGLPIRIIHPSFHDYLSKPERCLDAKWAIDEVQYRHTFATKCLNHVVKFLIEKHAIIALLGTREEAKQQLSAGMKHALRFWVEYIRLVPSGFDDLAAGIATILAPQQFLDWCTLIDVMWTRYIALDLTNKLMVWMKVHYDELSRIDARVTKAAMISIISAIPDYLDSPPPGIIHISQVPSDRSSIASSAPSPVTHGRWDRTADGDISIAMSAPASGKIIWHLTQPYKQLRKIHKELAGDANPKSHHPKVARAAEAP